MKFMVIVRQAAGSSEAVKEAQALTKKFQENWADVPGYTLEQLWTAGDLRTFVIAEATSTEAIVEGLARVQNTVAEVEVVPIAPLDSSMEALERGHAWATS